MSMKLHFNCTINEYLVYHSIFNSKMLKKLFFIALCVFCTNADNFFSHDVGQLHLSGQKWEIQHVLNLTEYIETSAILKDCIDNLNTVCSHGNNPLCSYFTRATENINMAIEADTSKLSTLSRNKRFIIFIPIILGVTIVSFWAGIVVAKSAMNSIKEEIRDNLDIIEQAANITISSVETMEKFIKDTDAQMLKLQEAINNNTRNLELQARFFNIINVISFSAQLHEKMQIKLNDIYYGDIESRLFEIIDFREFSKTVAKINKKLEPKLTLPEITSMSRNKFIKTYTGFNETHLTISVDLPVIRKSGFNISEFIPLPIRENDKLYMLDMPTTTYYINGTNIQLFPDENTRKSLCKTHEKMTICNTFLEEHTDVASICLNNILQNDSDENCTYKEIPYKNYFIQISSDLVYIHLIDPSIKVVMDCRGKVYALTFSDSRTVRIPRGCDIYKYTDKLDYNGEKITTFDITPQTIHSELNLANTDENKRLSLLPLWDKYNVQFIEAKEKVTRIRKSIPLQKAKIDKIDNVSLLPNFGLYDFFSNAITQFVILCIVLVIVLPLMKSMLIKLFTNWKK